LFADPAKRYSYAEPQINEVLVALSLDPPICVRW
jgi:hypothetical protein